MNFIAFDFETANRKYSSPCSIGIALCCNGVIEKQYHSLINPESDFDPMNIQIHQITPGMVSNAPIFPTVWDDIRPLFETYPAVAHNAQFDKGVLEATLARYGIRKPKTTYYCTYSLAKANSIPIAHYKLPNLCEYFGIDLMNHHCSCDDACACAQIFMKMLQHPEYDISPYVLKSHQNEWKSKTPEYAEADIDKYDDTEEVVFKGKSFVITGDVYGIPRAQLKAIIEALGGCVKTAISRKTNYLIVGMQDKSVVLDADHAKSTKVLAAEKLKANGADIKIISDEYFMKIIGGKNRHDRPVNV